MFIIENAIEYVKQIFANDCTQKFMAEWEGKR